MQCLHIARLLCGTNLLFNCFSAIFKQVRLQNLSLSIINETCFVFKIYMDWSVQIKIANPKKIEKSVKKKV